MGDTLWVNLQDFSAIQIYGLNKVAGDMAVLRRILDGGHHGVKVGVTHGHFLAKNINIRGVEGASVGDPLLISKCLYANHIGTAIACVAVLSSPPLSFCPGLFILALSVL